MDGTAFPGAFLGLSAAPREYAPGADWARAALRFWEASRRRPSSEAPLRRAQSLAFGLLSVDVDSGRSILFAEEVAVFSGLDSPLVRP